MSSSALANNVLFFTSYTPSLNSCAPEGTSRLFGVDVRTGTAAPFDVFYPEDNPVSADGDIVQAFTSLGQGMASAPYVVKNSQGTSVFTSKSTTEQIKTNVRTGIFRTGRQSWKQITLD